MIRALLLSALLVWPHPTAPRPSVTRATVETAPVLVEAVTTTVAMPQAAALSQALAGTLGRSTTADRAIAEARAGRIDPVELGQRLRASSAGHPELGPGLLAELGRERNPPLAMAIAQSLASLEEDERLRQETVDVLRQTPSARAVGMMALLGRGEREVVELASDSFVHDGPEARATAGFLLNNLAEPLDDAEEVLQAARRALEDPNTPARVREEAATLLGRKDASGADIALLERLVLDPSGAEVAVRARALAALDQTGLEISQLRSIFGRVARDTASPYPLAQMASAWLAAHA
jgi:hypothetical protein